MTSIKKETYNWGNYPKLEAELFTPSNLEELKQLVLRLDNCIARGNGRCYGDANLAPQAISTARLDKFISFDRQSGILHTEAGLLLSEILDVIVPAGFFLPVTPGTKFISVGGALASDVHGKNHHVDGCFSDHVLEFGLMNEQGQIERLFPNDARFWETAGGMGLNGVITDVKFKLKPIESAFIRQEAIKADNLEEIFALFEQSESWTYSVAWIDCLQKGKNRGRSILMRGEHAKRSELSEKYTKEPFKYKKKAKKRIPFFFPSFVLNTWSVKAFNFLYFHKQFKRHLKNIIDYDTFFYPLDSVLEWNRIYGKNGFIQYQFVIPKHYGKEAMLDILKCIEQSGQGSFLAVLKLFGKNNPKAYNAFPKEGYTLALDIKRGEGLDQLVKELDKLVEQYEGRIYRAKDSMSKPELTNYLMFDEIQKFESVQNNRIEGYISGKE